MKKLLVFLLVFATTSCSEKFFLSGSENVDILGDLTHDMIVLGDQLEDPYSVDNMTKALESLYPTKAGRVAMDPTDLYVRFLPKDEEEYGRLEALGLQLLDHPVDFEVKREGDWYHDPEIPDDEITWQYAVVPVDFSFPEGLRYEVLDECFIVDGNAATKGDGIDWEKVEREAYRLSGNEALLSPETKAGEGAEGPSGRIAIMDPEVSDEPLGVKGVMVSCNSFVKFANAYTDEDGNYSMKKSFSGTPRYRLVFKNKKGFSIGFNLLLIPASMSTLGKNSPAGVDVVISQNSERKLFTRSVVNNAGYDYYCSCESNGVRIKTPPTNLRIWLFQRLNASSAVMMQQGAFVDGSMLKDFLGEYISLVKMFLPDVTLGLKSAKTYSDVYNLTVHEMAHASHFMQVGKAFWDPYIKFIMTSFVTSGFVTYGVGTEANHGYCEVGEMWAYYVQSQLYRERYPDTSVVFGTNFWFSPQIFLYLDDRGLDRFKIFNALTSDITDKDKLQDKLLSLYPQMKSTINQAFGRYN
ncbi:MAG: hypothetical protein MJY91_01415 [Bacteroidales bacterium]|nr:hypothetical protein [Bacteroidales bacterium]